MFGPVLIQHSCEMDRFRKRLADFRMKVHMFVRHNWHNDPEGDVFRSLDILYIVGATRYKPTQKWQRICWNTYCAVSLYTFLVMVLNLVEEISGKRDLVRATWHATIVITTALCLAKDSILNQRFETIQTAQRFINAKPSGSGDTFLDSRCRKKLFQRLQATILAISGIVLTNEIIFLVPNSGIDELFGTPQILHRFGTKAARGLHCLFIVTAAPIWIDKFCTSAATICSLLYGFKTEYEIYVRSFENILDNVYSDVEQVLPSTLQATPEWKRHRRDKLYWKNLKLRINEQAEQHVQLVENMRSLQPIVSLFFGIVYYHAMVLFSPLFYVLLFSRWSVTSLCLLSGIALNLLECYGWCGVIAAYQDMNSTLEGKIMDLITKIPHSQPHHKRYVEMRTTLCIMKTFVRNNPRFSCGGVFPITVEAFTDLLNIGYTVFTFLKDVGKKG